MRDIRAAFSIAIVSALFVPVDGICLSEAERLAGLDSEIRDWQVTAGVGTGALYGGIYGAGIEAGYKEIALFGSLGPDWAVEHSAYSDGWSGQLVKSMEPGVVPEQEIVWRAGVKGYLAGEEMKFRPFVAAMVGPLMAYKINYNGELHSGKFTSFGLAAGCDWDPGAARGIVLSLGLSAFALTNNITGDELDLVRMVHKGDLPFINADLVAGLNYRF